jgi:hypothetical protein
MQFGSNKASVIPQAVNGIVDDNGNVVISGETGFGASPLGVAARTQSLYGVPNANFNLTPPSVDQVIVDGENPLPFWSVDDLSEGRITAKMFFNETDQTFAVELNPSAGSATDSLSLTTRSYLLNDSGIDLRQKAFTTLTKVGTYSGSNQWNLVMSATYYDLTGTSLSSFAIGTAADNVVFTGINGFTTTGTAIVSASAQYVDLSLTLTCAANVSGTAKVQVESVLLQTSTAGGGGGSQSFIIADTFSANGTWTKPAGVDYVLAVVAIGAGGGGGGGGFRNGAIAFGGGGGASAHWSILNNLYVGDVGSVTVSIGAGGSAGPGTSYSKVAGPDWPSNNTIARSGVAGGLGGATSFGTYISINGGGGGAGGTTISSGGTTATGGTVAGTFTNIVYDFASFGPSAGGTSVAYSGALPASSNGTSSIGTVFKIFPYTNTTTGTAGGAGTWTASPGSVVNTGDSVGGSAGAGGAKGMIGSGGGGANANQSTSSNYKGGTGGFGGPGGGGAVYFKTLNNVAGTWTVTAGNGGTGGTALGAGGGGGGAVVFVNGQGSSFGTASAGTFTSGSGGTGSSGYVAIIYVS